MGKISKKQDNHVRGLITELLGDIPGKMRINHRHYEYSTVSIFDVHVKNGNREASLEWHVYEEDFNLDSELEDGLYDICFILMERIFEKIDLESQYVETEFPVGKKTPKTLTNVIEWLKQ